MVKTRKAERKAARRPSWSHISSDASESAQTYKYKNRICQHQPLVCSTLVVDSGHFVVVLPYRFFFPYRGLWRTVSLMYNLTPRPSYRGGG